MRAFLGLISQVCSGLRFRLLVLVVIACAPLVVLTFHTAWQDRRQEEARWFQQSRKLLQVRTREEEELLGGTRQLLLALAESASVRSLNRPACKKMLDEVFASYPRYANLGLVQTNGEVFASALPLPQGLNLANRSFFRRTLASQAFAIGDFPFVTTNGRPTITFGYPAFDRQGQVQAVVFAQLDLNWYSRYGSELPAHLPKGATWMEIDRHGIILTRYPRPENRVGRMLPDASLVQKLFSSPSGVGETMGVRSADLGERNAEAAVLRRPSQAGSDRGVYFYAYGLANSQLASGKVASILSIPRKLLFAEADRNLFRNLTWLGIATSLALALGWIGSKLLILRPVAALVRSSARLAAGDLSARTGWSPTNDELGQLTRTFDQMAQALEERELARQRADQKLQVLSHRLVEVQETERRHIARELHDEIGQSLTAAGMHLQAALRSPEAPALERRLAESIEAVERVLEQVHDLSLNLRPSMLDDLGLVPALRWYTQRQAALAGLHAEFRADPLDDRLDPIIETECFRVAQEALTNVVRHAQARTVAITLAKRDSQLHLSVRDDGIGFDLAALRLEAVNGASLGLLSMEERAALANGGLEFNTAPGQGTEIRAWFPLKWKNPQAWSVINE